MKNVWREALATKQLKANRSNHGMVLVSPNMFPSTQSDEDIFDQRTQYQLHDSSALRGTSRKGNNC